MDDESPEYQEFKNRAVFEGTDVFELFPGDFLDEVQRWNPGSAYVREEAFEPFQRAVLSAAPDFDWYSETRLDRPRIERLLVELRTLRDKITRASSVEELAKVFGKNFRWYTITGPVRLELRRKQLLQMTDDLADVARTALSGATSLWILGL